MTRALLIAFAALPLLLGCRTVPSDRVPDSEAKRLEAEVRAELATIASDLAAHGPEG